MDSITFLGILVSPFIVKLIPALLKHWDEWSRHHAEQKRIHREQRDAQRLTSVSTTRAAPIST
jgi:hypothetical protein